MFSVQETNESQQNLKNPWSGNFSGYLQEELVRRCRNNPQYSLRTFARHLEMDPGSLSKVLSGKRKAGPRLVRKIGSRLGLSPDAVASLNGYPANIRVSEVSVNDMREDNKWGHESSQVSLDNFQLISEWYHYAILELMDLEQFKGTPAWISRTLGISLFEARSAIERLQRLKMIEINDDGKWTDLTSGFTTTVSSDYTAGAFKNLQRAVLTRAIKALDEVPYEIRDQSSMTLSFSQDSIEEAKEEIKKFRRKFTQKFGKKSPKDAAYHLGISFYPVTDLNPGDKNET